MPAASTKKADRKAVARSRVTNGADVLPNTDGRSAVVRRFRDITSAILNDQPEHCSEARLQLVRRFAAAACLAEMMEARLANGEQIDIAEHAHLSSTLCRLAQRIGVNRRMKNVTPDLHDYLEATNRTDDDVAVPR
jgi:hypothetical protein